MEWCGSWLRQVPAHSCRLPVSRGTLGSVASVEEACDALPTLPVVPDPGADQADQPGYRTSRCAASTRRCNERTGTPFNDLSVPTDIVFLVVLWRLRYPLSLRHLAEMFLERGFAFSHETVRSWESLVAPLLTEQLRASHKGKVGPRWHADETHDGDS